MIPMNDKQSQWRFAWRMFACGLAFYVASGFWPDVMPSQVYGDMARDIQAEIWALGFMSSSGMVAYGTYINGRWQWSPALRIAGHVALLIMFAYLCASAFSAPFGAVIVIYGGLFFIPAIVGFLRMNVADLMARARHGSR